MGAWVAHAFARRRFPTAHRTDGTASLRSTIADAQYQHRVGATERK